MNDRLRGDHPPGERLSEYLDDGLGARERESVARHLEACASCAGMLAELLAVRERARVLPPLAAPDSLWSAIEARLSEAPAKANVIDLGAERERRRWSFTTPQLAAAAAALMVVSATGAWFAGHRTAPVGTPAGPTSTPIAARTLTTPPDAGDTTASPAPELVPSTVASRTPQRETRAAETGTPGVPATAVNFGGERYDTAIADLERILAQNRSRLNPATVQVVEKNLALIDGAIEDARRALVADPASPYLNDHLAQIMKRKVDLLRRVTSRLQS